MLREALGERLTVLRPAAYHQNLLAQARAGMLSVPYSLDAPFTNVDLDDVAEVAADALLRRPRRADPRPRRAGGAHHPADDRGGRAAAGAAGRATRRIAAGGVGGRAGRRAGRPGADDLAAMFAAYDEGGLVGDPTVLPRLLGRAPTTWATRVSPVRGVASDLEVVAAVSWRGPGGGAWPAPAAGPSAPATSCHHHCSMAPTEQLAMRRGREQHERARHGSNPRLARGGCDVEPPVVPTDSAADGRRLAPARRRRWHAPRPALDRNTRPSAPSPHTGAGARAGRPRRGTTRWTSAPSTRCSRPPASR